MNIPITKEILHNAIKVLDKNDIGFRTALIKELSSDLPITYKMSLFGEEYFKQVPSYWKVTYKNRTRYFTERLGAIDYLCNELHVIRRTAQRMTLGQVQTSRYVKGINIEYVVNGGE